VPLVFSIGLGGELLSTSVVDAVQTLAQRVPFDVDTRTERDPTELVVDTTCFVRRIIPLEWYGSTGTPHDPDAALFMDDTTFYQVLPGAAVEFTVQFQNDGCFPGESVARLFKATIVVRGDVVMRLDERTVLIIVPAIPPVIG